jgi:hypothetical protein
MNARFFADLNPAYPATGQHRFRVFMRDGAKLIVLGKSFRSRKSAERRACELQVQHNLAALGFRLITVDEL